MDPMSTLRVPAELMEDATGNLSNPLMFRIPVSTLGEDAPELVVRSVICSIAEYLGDETVQAQLGKFLDDFLTTEPILPRHGGYERRIVLSCIVEAIQHAIGVR